MIQEWKDIEGFEGLYQVSNLGNIKSLERTVIRKNGRPYFAKEKECRCHPDGSGYLMAFLSKDGKLSRFKVHRLVASAFIPNLGNKPQVNHKDGNKKNNSVENLEWVTNSENIAHAYRNGLKHCNIKKIREKAMKKAILKCDLNGNELERFESIKEASRKTKINSGNISSVAIKRKGFKTAGGYVWRFADGN